LANDSGDEEENIKIIEMKALTSFHGELVEEVFDEDSFHISSEPKVALIKYKPHTKSCLKKTCKVKVPKKLTSVSK